MLTQEQADDLNLQLHKQEAAEIGLDKINQDLEKYTDMIRRVADMMKTATPEQKERIRSVAPRLLEEYNNLKLKKSTYEDSYREATSKINEYNTLNAQQSQVANQTKGRTINTNNFDWNSRWNNEYKNGWWIDTTWWTTLPNGTKVSPDGRTTVSPDWQVAMWVWIEQTLPYSNWVNAMMNWWETIISPDKRGIITPDWQVYMWVWIEQTFPYTYWVNAMMNNTNKNVLTSPYTNWVNAMMNKNTITSPYTNWVNAALNRNYTPVSEATLPWWISTANWPRYVSNKYQTPVSEATLPWWVSTVNWPRYMRT